MSALYVNGWEPSGGGTNGTATSPWTRGDGQRESQIGADVCWERGGATLPHGLHTLSAEEKEVRFSSILGAPVADRSRSSLPQSTHLLNHKHKMQEKKARREMVPVNCPYLLIKAAQAVSI